MTPLPYHTTQHGAAYHAFERARLHQALYELCGAVQDWLDAGYHLRGRRGAITKFDQWLQAVRCGEWPIEEASNGNC